MHSLILIGNGFDLAHGMKTSYRDFIDDYWEKKLPLVINAYNKKELKPATINEYRDMYDYQYEDEEIIIGINFFQNTFPFPNDYNDLSGYEKFKSSVSTLNKRVGINNLRFKNKFLGKITHRQSKYWVDIEIEYYHELIECFNNKKEDDIKQLNKDFLFIQNKLEEYLSLQMQNGINKSKNIENNLKSILQYYLANKASARADNYTVLFLNFNYTNTINSYSNLVSGNDLGIKFINIHGEIKNRNNPIIFGYGDEMDENFKIIKSKYDNNYLENMKLYKYAETDNYQNMLSFINSYQYEINILGHSCGISDRTLLSTLFENENCKLIKIFYHKRKDGTDNYGDIYKNISRIFTDDQLMKKNVVNKRKSHPLS
jgi:hypothetical protein